MSFIGSALHAAGSIAGAISGAFSHWLARASGARMGHVTTLAPLARCVIRGCPVRFRHGGDDRLCPWHGADDTSVNLATRSSGFGVTMTAFDGDHDRKDQQP
jgi:hypothetical protein